MAGFFLLTGLTALFLIYLVTESIVYKRRIERVPIRISVSGTRGKSSIVRTLASVLRSHGMKVLAKTTGSEAAYILPDGSPEKINRRGMTTILEQKKLISKAIDLDVQCIVTEIMSIHPDNHKIESRKLTRPGITILSNFRADHTDVVGASIKEISELFVNDICPGSKVIIHENEVNEFILKGIHANKARLITAATGTVIEHGLPAAIREKHIPANLDVVIATARYLGIPDETIRSGIISTSLDIGQLQIYRAGEGNRKIWFINSFAANDPVSTRQIIEKTLVILKPEFTGNPMLIGLIALRSDRGERSRQWLDYLNSDGKDLFSKTYVSGIHSHIFERKSANCVRLKSKKPEEITRQIIGSTSGDVLVFGVANIHGLGQELIGHWDSHYQKLT